MQNSRTEEQKQFRWKSLQQSNGNSEMRDSAERDQDERSNSFAGSELHTHNSWQPATAHAQAPNARLASSPELVDNIAVRTVDAAIVGAGLDAMAEAMDSARSERAHHGDVGLAMARRRTGEERGWARARHSTRLNSRRRSGNCERELNSAVAWPSELLPLARSVVTELPLPTLPSQGIRHTRARAHQSRARIYTLVYVARSDATQCPKPSPWQQIDFLRKGARASRPGQATSRALGRPRTQKKSGRSGRPKVVGPKCEKRSLPFSAHLRSTSRNSQPSTRKTPSPCRECWFEWRAKALPLLGLARSQTASRASKRAEPSPSSQLLRRSAWLCNDDAS